MNLLNPPAGWALQADYHVLQRDNPVLLTYWLLITPVNSLVIFKHYLMQIQ